jgi:replicative DNA helicase
MAEKKTTKSNTSLPDMTVKLNELYGRVPPQAADIEEVVIGALLIQSDAILLVMDVLSPESFYKPEHGTIYNAIITLSNNQDPIDILTVSERLKNEGKLESVGGISFLSSLTSRVATSAHLEFHAKIIQQKYIQRELIKASSEIQTKSFDLNEDVDELINYAEQRIFEISEGNIKKETQKIDSLLGKALEDIYKARNSEDKLLGVPSGFTDLDRYTSGWQKSDLVIIAARPSMGKTAFVLSMARNMAVDHNRPVALFSLEMSNIQLVNRLIAAETEIAGDKIRNGRLADYEWKQLESRIKSLESAPIFVDDTPAMSIFELRAKARRLVQTHQVQAIIVDYLQLMTAGVNMKGNREQEVSIISRSLKALAKELDVPVIALSQLNRSVETRSTSDKRPQLSDLRESGAIEQDADIVVFIHRPDYYGLNEDKHGNIRTGQAEIIIAKHRNGATGSCWLTFKQDFAKFSDLSQVIGDLDIESGKETVTFGSKMNDFESMPVNDEFSNDSNAEPGF